MLDLAGEAAHVVQRREVGLQRLRAGQLGRDGVELRGVAAVEQEPRPVLVQALRERAAQAVGCTRDEDRAVGDRAHDPRD